MPLEGTCQCGDRRWWRQRAPQGSPDYPPGHRSFINKLGQCVRHLVENDYQGRPFEFLGVSVPGLVDTQTGELVRAPNLAWSNVPVREWFQEITKLPVLVDNDANAAALAELWCGEIAREGVQNLLYVLVVEGLGSALIVGGKIYRGSRIGTGGFGHLCISPNGPQCTCGGRGCLEVFVSNPAIIASYLGKVSPTRQRLSVSAIINLARRGQKRAREVLVATAEKLAIGLRSLVHGLAPQVVVVGGELAEAWFLIGPIITEHLKGTFVVPELATVRMMPAMVRSRPSLVGAVTMGIFPEMTAPYERFPVFGPRTRAPSKASAAS